MVGRPGPRRRTGDRRFFRPRKVCAFCVDKVAVIDYKDVPRLRRYISDWAKIEPRRKTGTCAPHQRALSSAIKRARQSGLLPFTGGHSLMELARPDPYRGDRFRGDRRGRVARPEAVVPTETIVREEPAVAATEPEQPAAAVTEAEQPAVAEAEQPVEIATEPEQPAVAEAEQPVAEMPQVETPEEASAPEDGPEAQSTPSASEGDTPVEGNTSPRRRSTKA